VTYPEQNSNSRNDQKIKIALIGNPNCGKSTLFNALTGLNQKTGNFSGVTVDKLSGVFNHNNIVYALLDLPGTYSLNPKTLDEKIAFDVLTNPLNEDYPDIVLFVADALNLKRSLYLLSQIIDLDIPVVIAVLIKKELTL
jgi:ferrous iron transport protein B